MNLAEFKSEFQTKYDMGSFGAPDLNNYEMSLFLTQSVRDIVEEGYHNFETSEYIKRSIGPLVKEKPLTIYPGEDYIKDLKVFEVDLPADAFFILQENTKLNGVAGHVEIIPEDLDNLNKSVKNPFRKPNKNKIFRTEISNKRLRLYSSETITHYKIKYIKKYSPIILVDLSADPDLLQTETIEGKTGPTTTELPDFLHHKIVDGAVVLAIKSFRENNLKTQIEV